MSVECCLGLRVEKLLDIPLYLVDIALAKMEQKRIKC